MTFVCGTFFSLEKMPAMLKNFISILPLTHAIQALRGIALKNSYDHISIVVLFIYFMILYALGVWASYRDF